LRRPTSRLFFDRSRASIRKKIGLPIFFIAKNLGRDYFNPVAIGVGHAQGWLEFDRWRILPGL
jgi:hypothetical protein